MAKKRMTVYRSLGNLRGRKRKKYKEERKGIYVMICLFHETEGRTAKSVWCVSDENYSVKRII